MSGPNIEGQRVSNEEATAMEAKSLHPATEAILRYFEYSHLPDPLKLVSAEFSHLAWKMATDLPPNPEVTAGLRKLLEAKDCFVRAAL